MQLIQACAPKNVVLVHGSYENLMLLSSKIKEQIKVDCKVLSNGDTCVIETLIKLPTEENLNSLKNGINTCKARGPRPTPIKRNTVFTVHVAEENRIVMMNILDACKEKYAIDQKLNFCAKYKFDDPRSKMKTKDKLYIMFKEKLKEWEVTLDESSKITLESVEMEVVADEKKPSEKHISVSWSNNDEDIALYILEVLENLS